MHILLNLFIYLASTTFQNFWRNLSLDSWYWNSGSWRLPSKIFTCCLLPLRTSHSIIYILIPIYSAFIYTAKSIVFNFEIFNNRLLKSSWEQEGSLTMSTKSTVFSLTPPGCYLLKNTTVASPNKPQTLSFHVFAA